MSTKTQPRIYLLHGDDEFTMRQEVRALRGKMNDPSLLNTALFDGAKATAPQIIAAASAYPFLAERRLVLVEGMLANSKMKAADWKAFAPSLESLPETTRLVFAERGKADPKHPLAIFLAGSPFAYIKEFAIPEHLNEWITRRVKAHGGTITPAAANLLASIMGRADVDEEERQSLTYAVDGECEKLVLLAGEHPISEAHIEQAVSYLPESRIWDLVDAIGQRDGKTALTVLRYLCDQRGQKPLAILPNISRQIRQLIQAREQIDARRTVEIPEIKAFQLRKIVKQAQNFELAQLERIYRAALEADFALKNGEEDVLEIFIAKVAG
jgi:DNA polymerase III subunit delta